MSVSVIFSFDCVHFVRKKTQNHVKYKTLMDEFADISNVAAYYATLAYISLLKPQYHNIMTCQN